MTNIGGGNYKGGCNFERRREWASNDIEDPSSPNVAMFRSTSIRVVTIFTSELASKTTNVSGRILWHQQRRANGIYAPREDLGIVHIVRVLVSWVHGRNGSSARLRRIEQPNDGPPRSGLGVVHFAVRVVIIFEKLCGEAFVDILVNRASQAAKPDRRVFFRDGFQGTSERMVHSVQKLIFIDNFDLHILVIAQAVVHLLHPLGSIHRLLQLLKGFILLLSDLLVRLLELPDLAHELRDRVHLRAMRYAGERDLFVMRIVCLETDEPLNGDGRWAEINDLRVLVDAFPSEHETYISLYPPPLRL